MNYFHGLKMANKWVYLSPHFDDVALSVGGLVWEQVQQGDQVEVWTICGGNAPLDKPLPLFARILHSIWKLGDDVPNLRAQEDEAACRRLGAAHRRFLLPDCIYRYNPITKRPFVRVQQDLFKPYTPIEFDLMMEILKTVRLPKETRVVAPLGVGKHRDHRLTRAIAERLYSPVWHYIDYPYAVQNDFKREDFIPQSTQKIIQPISSQGIIAWKDAIACHHSQIALFWKSEQEMFASIDTYAEKMQKDFLNTYLWKF
jgi:LmbE family N-acetylglucosaminyl deacetylase